MSKLLAQLRAIFQSPRRWLFPLFHLFDRTREERTPRRLAAGIALGLCIGLTPRMTLHWPLLVGVAICLPWNPLVTLLSSLFFLFLSPFAEQPFHLVGYTALSSGLLEPFWRFLYDTPLFPFTRFDRSLVTGSFLFCAAVSVPLYLGLRTVLERHGARWWVDLQATQLWAAWSTSWLRRRYHGLNAFGKVDPSGLLPLPPPPRWLRPEGAWIVGGVLGLCLLAVPIVGNTLTERAFERLATRFNGAAVRIDGLRIRWFRSAIEIDRIRVGDPGDGSQVLADLTDLVVKFRIAPLLWKKVVIESIETRATGPRAHDYASERRELGEIRLLDRIGSAFPLITLRRRIRQTPLRSLGRLATSVGAMAKTDGLRGQLKTEERLVELSLRIDEVSSGLTRETGAAGSEWAEGWRRRWREAEGGSREPLREELVARRPLVVKQLKTFSDELTKLEGEIGAADSLIEADIAFLREQLELPRTDFEDLSPELLGPAILSLVDRMSYWVEVARARFPNRAERLPAQRPEIAAGSLGSSFEFATSAASAAFRVERVRIRSEETFRGGASGILRFEAKDLSTDPTSAPGPMTAAVEMSLPAEGNPRLRGELIVDHRDKTERETFTLRVERFPITHWMLNHFPDLQLGVEHARAGIDLRVEYDGNSIRGEWKADATNADYFVSSHHKQAEETLRQIMEPIGTFVFKGTLSGNTETGTFTGTSELGNRVAAGIRREYKNPLLAVDDYLRRLLLDKIDRQQKALRRRLDETRARLQEAFDDAHRSLASLETIAGLDAATRSPATPSDSR